MRTAAPKLKGRHSGAVNDLRNPSADPAGPFHELEFLAACSCEQHVDAAVGLPRLEQRRSERRGGGVGRIWTAERGLERSGLSPPDGALSAEVLRDQK